MELRHLRYFVAVADELSFTRGAAKLRIAQPSLTRQIRDLEEYVGARLLDRTKKKIRLTKEGECFLVGAKRVLNDCDELVESVQGISRQTSCINIGYIPNLFHKALSASIPLLRKQFPNVSASLFGMNPDDQLRALNAGKIDIGFVGLLESADEPSLKFQLVALEQAVAVLPADHRLAKKSTVNLKDLASMFLVGLSDVNYPGYSRWLSGACHKAGFEPKILHFVGDESMAIQAVRSDLGIALLPDEIKKVRHQSVVIRAIEPSVFIGSSVAWKTDHPSAPLKSYLKIVTELGRESSGPGG